MPDDEMYQTVQDGFVSPVQSDLYPIHLTGYQNRSEWCYHELVRWITFAHIPGCRCPFADKRKSKRRDKGQLFPGNVEKSIGNRPCTS